MILKDLHISGFGKYTNKEISFTEGINVIYGENGSGKSTLHAYLRSMLFGLERGRGRAAATDTYSRYNPWSSRVPYGGSLSFSTGEPEETYLIERTLDTQHRSLVIRNAATGKAIGSEQTDLDRILGRLTEDIYRNTISIEQLKAATDQSLSSGLKNHLSSLALTGSSSLDVSQTLDTLKAKKKELKQHIDEDSEKQLESLNLEIESTREQLNSIEQMPQEFTDRLATLEKGILANQKMQEELETLEDAQLKKLSSSSFFDMRNPDIYQDRLEDAFQAHQLAARESSRLRSRSSRILSLIGGLFVTLIFALFGCFVLFKDKLSFMNFPFSLPVPACLIIGFGGAGIALILTLFLTLRSGKDHSDSRAMAEETEQFLIKEFRTHLKTDVIDQEGMQTLLDKVEAHRTLIISLDRTREAAEDCLRQTVLLQKQLQEAREEADRFQKKSWEFEQIHKRLNDLEDRIPTLRQIAENNRTCRDKIQAITIAESTIRNLSAKLHESFSPQLNRMVSDILFAITDGVYEQVFIDEELHVTVRSTGRTIPLESLSRGTIEQIYLALRISAVQILFPEASFPILLDDTFAYYDDARLHNTLKWLAGNYSGQVLLFTCQKREPAFLSRLEVPYHLISLS